MAAVGPVRDSIFVCFMFGYLAYASYQILRAYDRLAMIGSRFHEPKAGAAS